MEYQKIINLLDNTSNQACKFWTKDWVEIQLNLNLQCSSQVYVITVMHVTC